MKSVTIIGLGYIGLPSAAMFANYGFQVNGVDINKEAVDIINQGKIHIVEPDLDAMVRVAVTDGKLKAFLKPCPADVFIIAVPTPIDDNKKPDLSYVKSATQSIAPTLKKGDLVILESTSPVGTTEQMSTWLSELRPDLTMPTLGSESAGDIYLAYCPERVMPGQVLHELIHNDRVIGGMTKYCAEKGKEFYKYLVKGQCFTTDCRTAELSKLTENAFRDVNIAFANELSVICDDLSINVWELIKLANRHPRVNILQPGPGVGGHCIAVDPWFIIDSAPKHSQLLQAARNTNLFKPEYIVKKVLAECGRFKAPTIACLGLAFKKDIDDVRESPSVEIVQQLFEKGIKNIYVVEPNIKNLPDACVKAAQLVSLTEAINEADIIVVLVDHKDFLNYNHKSIPKGKIIIDTKGIWQ